MYLIYSHGWSAHAVTPSMYVITPSIYVVHALSIGAYCLFIDLPLYFATFDGDDDDDDINIFW